MKFQIKSISGKTEREGDSIIRYTGNEEPFSRGTEMTCSKIGEDREGNPKFKFNTGLDEDQIDFYGWLTKDEKEEFRKFLRENRPLIAKRFGGEEVIDSTNQYFWLRNSERNKIIINNETLNIVFDTKNVEHCLLYINIIGGAFIDIVAPNKEMANDPRALIPHYIELESDFNNDDVNELVSKATAYSLLTELKDADGDALLFLSWCLQYQTKAFGAFNRSSSKNELFKYNAEFIEGKLSRNAKRNCPKEFIEYANKWKSGGLTKDSLIIKAYLQAAEYYSYLNTNIENKYQLPSGLVLGNSIDDAVTNIKKPKNTEDLNKLRDFVENKWKE